MKGQIKVNYFLSKQDYNFLVEGGFLAIVIPDGILTNSSMQYVRDNIEEWYRIVAVVSMPQTAFAHTGAESKSSVLFCIRNKETQKPLKAKKHQFKREIKAHYKYLETMNKLENEKSRTQNFYWR